MNIFILEDDNDFLKVIFQVFNHQPSLECMLDHHTYTRWFTTEILLIWIFFHITYVLLYSSDLLAGVSFVEKSDGTDLFDFM